MSRSSSEGPVALVWFCWFVSTGPVPLVWLESRYCCASSVAQVDQCNRTHTTRPVTRKWLLLSASTTRPVQPDQPYWTSARGSTQQTHRNETSMTRPVQLAQHKTDQLVQLCWSNWDRCVPFAVQKLHLWHKIGATNRPVLHGGWGQTVRLIRGGKLRSEVNQQNSFSARLHCQDLSSGLTSSVSART